MDRTSASGGPITLSVPPPGTIHRMNPQPVPSSGDSVLLSFWGMLVRWLIVLAATGMIVLALAALSQSLRAVESGRTDALFSLATNPLAGLLTGLIITAVIQSSTTTTTVSIAAVASGTLPVAAAVPIIMGANIGTSLTPCVVALGFIARRQEYTRAMTLAATHVLVNAVLVCVLLPLELVAHPLERLAAAGSRALIPNPNQELSSATYVATFLQPAMGRLFGAAAARGVPVWAAAVAVAVGAAVVLLLCLWLLRAQLQVLLAARQHLLFEHSTSTADGVSFVIAGTLTALIHSSTAVVGSMTPAAATGLLSPRAALPMVLGANVGTTLTPLVAIVAVPGQYSQFALEAALIHLLFNLCGALLFMPTRAPGRALLAAAEAIAGRGFRRRGE